MVKAYAVNCNDAWLIPDDEPKEGHYVKYEDYAALEKERNALKRLIELAYDSPISDEGMHWVNQAVNNLEAWLDE